MQRLRPKCESGVFALYEDGLVIFTGRPPDCRTMQSQVTPAAAGQLVDDLFTLGFASFPHWQSVAGATDLGGVTMQVRRGRRWHATEVYGLTRFGDVVCCNDEIPYPRLVGVVRHLTAFDAQPATVWTPQEFAVSFNSGVYYPPEDVARAVPWPVDIPQPVLDPKAASQTRVFDGRFLERARSLKGDNGPPFVIIDGKPWAAHVFPVMPEHLYHEALDRALSLRASAARALR